MSTGFESPALLPATKTLRLYLSNETDQRPFYVVGAFGSGRGHAIQATCLELGVRPTWCYEPEVIPPFDLNGTPCLAIYDLDKPWPPPCERGIVLIDNIESIPYAERKKVVIAGFPKPSESDLRRFSLWLGYPEAAFPIQATTYTEVKTKVASWQATGKVPDEVETDAKTWEAFASGGDAPIDMPLLVYYGAYHQEDRGEMLNSVGWLERRIPAMLSERAWDAVRLKWPTGVPRFPSMLRSTSRTKKVVAPVAASKKRVVEW